MDPCPFVRIVIENLALKFPVASNGIHSSSSSSSSCYCKIQLKNYPTQFSTTTLHFKETFQIDEHIHACFNLNKSEFHELLEKSTATKKPSCLKIEIYTGLKKENTCGLNNSGKLLGSVSVPLLDLKAMDNRSGCVIQNGWVKVDGSAAELHLNVRAEPDPRFVFKFDGAPECSPQVFLVNGNVRQPVFTCKFSFRNCGERDFRSRSSVSETNNSRSWLSLLTTKKVQPLKERKGWSVTIHDLSGSPVATASMVTPFVPSPGTDHVSRSNPGAWLILRPGHGTWKPWGRLEAWRERGGDHLSYRYDLLHDDGVDSITMANSTISTKNGGKFTIDGSTGSSPIISPSNSYDFSSGSGSGSEPESESWAHLLYRGFVMSSTIQGDRGCIKPEVEIGVQHVTCTEDAAVFVALAAAMELSMDACRLFSQKLRKELRQPDKD